MVMLSRHHRHMPRQRTDQGCTDRDQHIFVRYLGWSGYGQYQGSSEHLDETLNARILAFGELDMRPSLLFDDGCAYREASL